MHAADIAWNSEISFNAQLCYVSEIRIENAPVIKLRLVYPVLCARGAL